MSFELLGRLNANAENCLSKIVTGNETFHIILSLRQKTSQGSGIVRNYHKERHSKQLILSGR